MANSRFSRFWPAGVLAALVLATALSWLATAEAAPDKDASPPAVSAGPAIISSPAEGDTYGRGEVVELALTFDRPVEVTGEPGLRLTIGEARRWAKYDRSDQDDARLIFVYAINAADSDDDGIKVAKNQLKLRKGAIADDQGVAARLRHPVLPDQAGHKVDGSASGDEETNANPGPNTAPVFTPLPHPGGSPYGFRVTEKSTRGAVLTLWNDADDMSGTPVLPSADATANTLLTAQLAATDADGDSLTYSLSGEHAALFKTTAAGVLQVAAKRLALDPHTDFWLTATVSDGNGGSDEAMLHISVRPDLNVPDAPSSVTITPGDHQVTLSWGWSANTRITKYQIWRKDEPKWRVIAGSDSNTSQYTVTGLDNGTRYKFRIRAMIGNSPGPASRLVQATPTDKTPNQPPSFDDNVQAALLFENAKRGTVLYELDATDPDGDTLSFSLTGRDAAHFNIDADGVVTVAKKRLRLPGRSNYSFGAEVVDETGGRDNIALAGYVNPRDVPLFTHGQQAQVAADAAVGTVVHTMQRLDPYKRLRLSYRFLPSSPELDPQSRYFSIDADGVITVRQALGNLSGTSFRLFVDAMDADGNLLNHSEVLVAVE